jgi:RHS repeat-associated protein
VNVAEVTLTLADLYEQVAEYTAGATEPTRRTHKYRVYAGGRQIAQVSRVESGGSVGDDQVYYLHDDPLGTTTAITDVNGQVTERRRFLAFGEEDPNSSSPGTPWSTTGVMSGFTGHQHDRDLGLINMKGRLYDPRLGRFMTPDPFVAEPLNPQGLNRYSYVQNNPMNFVDPTGFEGEEAGVTAWGQDSCASCGMGYPQGREVDSSIIAGIRRATGSSRSASRRLLAPGFQSGFKSTWHR